MDAPDHCSLCFLPTPSLRPALIHSSPSPVHEATAAFLGQAPLCLRPQLFSPQAECHTPWPHPLATPPGLTPWPHPRHGLTQLPLLRADSGLFTLLEKIGPPVCAQQSPWNPVLHHGYLPSSFCSHLLPCSPDRQKPGSPPPTASSYIPRGPMPSEALPLGGPLLLLSFPLFTLTCWFLLHSTFLQRKETQFPLPQLVLLLFPSFLTKFLVSQPRAHSSSLLAGFHPIPPTSLLCWGASCSPES